MGKVMEIGLGVKSWDVSIVWILGFRIFAKRNFYIFNIFQSLEIIKMRDIYNRLK
jgi:hypothetical protein